MHDSALPNRLYHPYNFCYSAQFTLDLKYVATDYALESQMISARCTVGTKCAGRRQLLSNLATIRFPRTASSATQVSIKAQVIFDACWRRCEETYGDVSLLVVLHPLRIPAVTGRLSRCCYSLAAVRMDGISAALNSPILKPSPVETMATGLVQHHMTGSSSCPLSS